MSSTEVVRRARERRTLPPPDMRRAIRRASGETLAAIAGAMVPPVTATAIYHWERGSPSPQPAHLSQYAQLLQRLARLIPAAELEELADIENR